MKIGEAIYGAQGAGGGDDAGGGASQPNEPGVVDAEFEEVDGQNKKSA
jgi:molecular chaperone DnaK